jgi:hypothetical protein
MAVIWRGNGKRRTVPALRLKARIRSRRQCGPSVRPDGGQRLRCRPDARLELVTTGLAVSVHIVVPSHLDGSFLWFGCTLVSGGHRNAKARVGHRGMHIEACISFLATHSRSSPDGRRGPLHEESAGNAGRWPHPWPACNKKRRRQSPQVSRDIPAFPARWLYGLLRALPRDRRSCPCHRRDARASQPNLASAPGSQDHTT